MKIYVSADIEGTTGITLWNETENGMSRYTYFAEQMTREVAAACEGAAEGGADRILVKDAHDSACNIIPDQLPEDVLLFRGWERALASMVAGLDESYDGVIFTGYHSGAGMDTNPLAHTMNRGNLYVKINGEIAPELLINSYTAAYHGVPVRMVTGDRGLCELIHRYNPNIVTVPVSEGCGAGSISIHPKKAVRLIREAAKKAVETDAALLKFPLPKHFCVDIFHREHFSARAGACYPGVTQIEPHVTRFESDDWGEVLKMIKFVL